MTSPSRPTQSRAGCSARETSSDYAAFAEAVHLAREAADTATMDETEFVSHVSAAVRRGSVTAMRLWRRSTRRTMNRTVRAHGTSWTANR
jgi:hypothetical protein